MRRSSVESMVSMQRGEAIVNNESDDTIKDKHSECSRNKHSMCEDNDGYSKVSNSQYSSNTLLQPSLMFDTIFFVLFAPD